MKVSASARLRLEPPASARSSDEQLEHAVDGGDGGGVDLGGQAGGGGELVGVAEQAEAGHVGQRVGARRAGLRAPRGR